MKPLSAQAIARAVDAAHGVRVFDRVVYQSLATYCFSEPICWPAQQTIADDLGCKQQQVSRAIGRLKRAGWLEIIAKRRGRWNWDHNIYGLLHAWKPLTRWVAEHICARAERRLARGMRTNSRGSGGFHRPEWVPPRLAGFCRLL